MIANGAWLVEFILEGFGAVFFFRRRTAILWVYLGFRALADIASFAALSFSYQAYNWVDYVQRTVQYVLLAVVVMYVVAMIFSENKKTRQFYAMASAGIALWAIAQFHGAYPLTAQSVWIFETWMEFIISAFVAVAMGVMNGRAPKPWGLIACGLVILGGSDAALNAMRVHGWHVEAFYPIGAIVGLGILAWAAIFPQGEAVWELRLNITPRVPDRTLWLDESANGSVN